MNMSTLSFINLKHFELYVFNHLIIKLNPIYLLNFFTVFLSSGINNILNLPFIILLN